jgi:hypothetical protein
MTADTTLLRCLAAFLIVNSHLESYYPIRQLAADGLLGNSLFLLLSGFGLVLSETRARRPFLAWYARRAGRIVPSVALTVLLFDYLPASAWKSWDLKAYVLNFLWAESYPFIGMILTLYIAFYGTMRRGRPSRFLVVIGLLFPAYVAAPLAGRSDALFHALHWVFYFQVMLFGGWLAHRSERLEPGGLTEAAALAGLLAGYVGLRLCVSSARMADWFFLPFLLVFPMVYLLLRLSRAAWVVRLMQANGWIALVAGLVGGATLEVYLVHGHLIPIPWIARLPLPLNVLALFIVSAGLAWLLARAVGLLRGLPRQVRLWRSTRLAVEVLHPQP